MTTGSKNSKLTENNNSIKFDYFIGKKVFTFAHLNINSILPKLVEVNEILDKKYDLVSFNETKLDNLIPNNFYVNDDYQMIRRDRNRHGGGLLVFIREEYKIVQFDSIKRN